MFRAFTRNLCASLALTLAMAAVLTLRGVFNPDNLLTALGISCALGFSGIFERKSAPAPKGESHDPSPIRQDDAHR